MTSTILETLLDSNSGDCFFLWEKEVESGTRIFCNLGSQIARKSSILLRINYKGDEYNL